MPPTQLFLHEFHEILQNIFFTDHPGTTIFERELLL